RTRTIELITTNIHGNEPTAIAEIGTIAAEHGFPVSIVPTTLADLPAVLAAIPNRMVAGTLLYAQDVTLDYAAVARMVKRHLLVQMGGKTRSSLASVLYDQGLATENAIQHLIDLGHRHIAFLGGQQQLLDGTDRYHAYVHALTRNRLPSGPVAMGDFGAPSGEEAMRRILEMGEPFTAVFASADAMAISALHVLRQAGLRVPDDVSVVGYNDSELAPYVVPPLTTIVNDSRALARMTTEYLFEFIDRPDTPRQQRIITPDLIVRGSTAPPPG
ncbi:MAG: substrate-binding domain-containing protein, partial [Chloroflexota bacterium]|nr:substrate-binding domain-containing protein [Chloroflexota bacterium]